MTTESKPAPEPVLPLTVATLEALATSRRDLWRLCAPQGDARGRAWTVINAFEAAVRKDERERAVAAAALGDKQQALPAVVDNSFLEWVYADLPISERDKLTIRNRIFRALTEPAVVDDEEHKDGG